MQKPKKLLGLDVGAVTIGVAISDNLGITAQGLMTYKRQGFKAELRFLQQLVTQYGITEIVVGLPKRLDGSLGPEAQRILRFIERLQKALSLPVHSWDERLTTLAAERVLLAGNLRRAQRKQVIDKVAAQLILQGYLDRQGVSASADDTPQSEKGEKEIRSPSSDQRMEPPAFTQGEPQGKERPVQKPNP